MSDDFLVQAILIGLAAWRISALLSYERGPFDLFQRFRNLLGYTHDDTGVPASWPDGWREIFSCVWCLSPWMAAACWGLWELEPLIVMVIAASSIVIIIERWNHGQS